MPAIGPDLILSYHDIVSDDWIAKSNQRVYALIHDPVSKKAVDFEATSPFPLVTFDGDQERFSTFLTQDGFRTRYYSKNISCTGVDLPDVGYGSWYEIEYWAASVTGTVAPNRATDIFLGVEKLTWISDRRAESRLDLVQEENIAALSAVKAWERLKTAADDIPGSMGEHLVNLANSFGADLMLFFINSVSATFENTIAAIKNSTNKIPAAPASVRWECFLSLSYDTETLRVGYTAWLEKDGQLQTDALQASITLRDSTQQLITNLTVTPISPQGQFVSQSLGVNLNPDETYFAVCEIKDSAGVNHTSGSSPVTWD